MHLDVDEFREGLPIYNRATTYLQTEYCLRERPIHISATGPCRNNGIWFGYSHPALKILDSTHSEHKVVDVWMADNVKASHTWLKDAPQGPHQGTHFLSHISRDVEFDLWLAAWDPKTEPDVTVCSSMNYYFSLLVLGRNYLKMS